MSDRSKFAQRTQRVLSSADDEAARLQHEYIGTEHLLLGLLTDEDGVGVAVLHNLGVDFSVLRREVEKAIKRGLADNQALEERPFTTPAKRVLELAAAEAQALGHSYVGTEHLLLGLLVERMGIGGQVLNAAGISADAARTETVRLLGPPRGAA